ncbi:MAG: hypothetical protein JSS86_24320, partial [Cyanobacteria bacterium SZAS LIN-2]|nr:hypothetical protein [Cyanobacteria bacterium SZAS LIN-2]
IVASGAGGGVNSKGADGGNVSLTGSALFLSGVEATGGGGGGGNASPDGGAGGNGGNITLNSSGPIIIEDFSPAPGYLNVSGGGGGGGGGGGSATGAAGKGGAGGKAGTVTINTNSLFFAGGVLAADGAAGGDGGDGIVGTAGGGGGGGGGAFGGGGGGGAAGADATGTGSAVGGGGGAGFYEGGGGGAGATGKAVVTAGTGGSSTGQFNPTPGLGGTIISGTGMAGTDGSANAGGAGGIPTGSGLTGGKGGQNGGATFGIGGGSDANAGKDGKEISTKTGSGIVNISVGAASGSLAEPIGIATTKLNVTGTTKNSALFLSGFSDYTEVTSAKFAGGTLNVLGGNGLTVTGAISGADNLQLSAFGVLDVKNTTISATNVSLQTFNSTPTSFDGDITVGAGALIKATTAKLTAENNVNANTEVTNLSVASGGSSVTINESATAGKALNLLASNVGSGGTFTVNSAQQINVTQGITAFNGTINLNETGTLSKIGINITSNLNVVAPLTGVKGTVNLSTTGGNASIINTVPITAIDLSINADGAVGSSSKAFATNVTGTLTVNGNSHDLISIKDANINAPTLTGKSTVFGQSISFVSAAKNLSVGNLGYTNVTLNNTFATAGGGATLTLNPTGNIANVIGDGFGTVSITTAAAEIDQGKTVTVPVILAKNLVLKSTAADVGGAGLGLSVSASSITASAAKGSVSIQDAVAASLGAGSALKTYNVSADGLTVAGAITGDVITLTGTGASGVVLNANVGATKSTTVNIIGGSGITQNSKAVATGLTVNLKANSSGDIGTAGQSILTKAGTTLTVVGSNNGQAFVKQTGSVAIGTSVGTGSSVLNLTGTGNLNIKGAVSFGAINLTAPVVEVFSGGGSLGTLNGLTVTAPVVKFDSGSTSIIAGGATFKSASGLAISGSDAALTVAGSLTLGGTVGGKQTTSITLGDAKTGANNPLATELNKTLSAITVNTTGNFTGSLQKIATDDTALGGKIDITAAKIVNVNAVPSLAPIVISADATAGPAGKVILNLTGTQSVSLGVGTVAKGDPQITISTSGGTGGGTVSVSSAGLLTVDNGGVAQSGTARNLTLIGAKGLSVTDANLLKTNLNSLTLSSGSTKAFTIGEGALPVNGTAGDIVASSVDINAGGGIVLAKTHTIAATVGSTFSNDTGALTITGDDKSITPGLALALSAKGAISLGDIKNGGINNPLSDIGNETLDSLSITAGGNFTGNYPVIALKPGGVMNITATNIVNVGSNPLAPIQLKAENSGGPAGSVILNLTGTQAITLGNLSVLKGQPQIQISVDGLVGGIVDVKTAGALTVNNGGVKFGSGLHDLTLSGGKGLSVTDTTLLNTNLGVVSLRSGATTPFVVGAAPASKDLLNGTAGDIKADSVSVTALKGITVAAASAITASGAGGSLTLDTTSLLNNGTISGKDAGSTLSFADSGKSNLGISALGIGVYQNFGHVSFNTGGNIDLGNLFTSGTTLATGLNSIDIQAGGSVTFASFLPTLNVAPGGSITVHAGSLVTKASTPIDFIATGSATIDISTKSALTLGAGKGTIALTVAPTGSDVTLVSTGGTLTVDTALSAGTIELRGSSVVVKQVVTAGSGDLTALAVGKTGTLTTVGSGLLVNSVGDVIVGQGSTKLAATPILVNTTSLLLGDSAAAGALNVSNSSGSASSVGGLVPIAGLSYNALKDISVDNISTTAGALTINTKGSLSTATGVTLSSVGGGINLITSADPGNTIIIGKNNTITASSGSILIQNNNLVNGTISILSGVNILGSGTAKGVGQVSIVMGAVPAESALRPGVVPANTTIKSTGGAGVFFGSVAFPNDSIVANGSNILFAEGRNVVFATRGMGASTITINGGTITADPPAGAASSMAPATGLTGTTLGSSVTAPTLTSGELRQSMAYVLPAIEPTSQIAPLPALTSALAASAQRFASMPGSLYAGYGPSASGNVTQYGVGAGSGGQGERRLERGAVLLTSDETTTVQTTFGSVTAAPGALALLVAFDGGVAVYNLHDDKKDAVVIRCGNRRVSVGPGRSTVITNRVGAKFEAVNPAHFVGYRRMSENDYGQGLKAFHSEFNTYSLMRGVDAIKKLIASDNPKERKIASAMLKTSAILLGLGNDQQFKLMLPPQMTAMIGNNTSR